MKLPNPMVTPKNSINEIPVLGKIAAGTPIEAIENEVSKVTIPEELSKKKYNS